MSKHALVLGASGIQGWAIVNELLQGQNRHVFPRVTAATNRPLDPDFVLWPQSSTLQVVHGIELDTTHLASVVEGFRKKILDVELISHVYYCGRRILQFKDETD